MKSVMLFARREVGFIPQFRLSQGYRGTKNRARKDEGRLRSARSVRLARRVVRAGASAADCCGRAGR